MSKVVKFSESMVADMYSKAKNVPFPTGIMTSN